MIYSIEEITEKIRPIAEKHKLTEVYLFGSYARGDATEESDVDLLIDGNDLGGFKFFGMWDEFENALGKEVDIVTVFSFERVREKNSTNRFVQEVDLDRRKIL